MILLDTNLLVYAHAASYLQDDAARDWLEDQLLNAPRVGLPWSSLLAFVRLVSSPRVFTEPEPMADAWSQVDAWLDAEATWTPVPTPRHRDFLRTCMASPGLRANDVPDAHLAALAMEHGVSLATRDGGWFRQVREAELVRSTGQGFLS